MTRPVSSVALHELGLTAWRKRESLAVFEPERALEATGTVVANEPTMPRRAIPVLAGMTLTQLQATIRSCNACQRSIGRIQATPGIGQVPARLLLLDLVPSVVEASSGEIMAGDAGRLLDQVLFALGLNRAQVYLSHALRCDGTSVDDADLNTCSAYLEYEITLVAPAAILALGANAKRAIETLPGIDTPVFLIEHPVSVLGDASAKRRLWNQLRQVRGGIKSGRG